MLREGEITKCPTEANRDLLFLSVVMKHRSEQVSVLQAVDLNMSRSLASKIS